ncbi:hypothetical protein WMY93_013587 [Mugilogobius chulae]|uniref:MYND-type domain-containing protein n=1 Tax=Mugilogobius chulae TaxID=88201 RepID=A0AAW0P6R1_9GOBI
MSTEKVILGFLEEVEAWRLLSPQFPSKVGGKPAWLSQKGVPSLSSWSARSVIFQWLFCFRCMRLYRVKIKDEPPSEPYGDYNVLPVSGVKLCWTCGCPGTKTCSRCHFVNYCGKHHQTIHWKHSHKRDCGSQETSGAGKSPFLFPEFELVTEPEEREEKTETQSNETEAIQSNVDETLTDVLAETELDEMALHETEEMKIFQRFKKRIAPEPHQVVRYSRGGLPLWISAEHIPSDEAVPPCSCGSKRVFEFQVMPQLLNSLCVDSTGASIDWGTVAVFTCSRSCSQEDNYSPEFVWKQDFKADQINKDSL